MQFKICDFLFEPCVNISEHRTRRVIAGPNAKICTAIFKEYEKKRIQLCNRSLGQYLAGIAD